MIKLTLPLPPSSNRYWRSIVNNGRLRVLKSKEAREFRERCGWIAKAQVKRKLSGPVALSLMVYFPDRRGDLDNRTKQLFDALQGTVYENDSQVVHYEVTRKIDKENPRVEVEVFPWEGPRAA